MAKSKKAKGQSKKPGSNPPPRAPNRPKIRDKIDIVRVETLASRGLTKEQVYACLGISKRTYMRAQNENPLLEEAFNRGRAKGVAFAAEKLMGHIKNQSLGATIFFLKAVGGMKETNVTELANKEDKPLTVAQITDAEALRAWQDSMKPQ